MRWCSSQSKWIDLRWNLYNLYEFQLQQHALIYTKWWTYLAGYTLLTSNVLDENDASLMSPNPKMCFKIILISRKIFLINDVYLTQVKLKVENNFIIIDLKMTFNSL